MDGDMWAMLAAVLLTSSAAVQQTTPKLQCQHERCKYIGYNLNLGYRYKVDGNRISIIHDASNLTLAIDCDGASVLESPALPRAEVALRVSDVELRYCPPPATGSLADTLSALNVTLLYSEEDTQPRGKLALYKLPPAPPLAAQHFVGLDRLVYLDVFATRSARGSPESGFLAPLRSLRTLSMWNVELPSGELAAAPPSLRALALSSARVERLPEAIYASSALRELTVHSMRALDAVTVPSGLAELELDSPATTLRLDAAPALETLSLSHWTESMPPPLARCDSLRELRLKAPAVNALPDGWLTNCSRLENLVIQHARNLTALPAELIVGANALTHLALSSGELESLPAGLLNDLPNLRTLELNNNRIRTILSGTFAVARRVRTLDLSSNDLEDGAIDALAPLEELTELNLASNSHLDDVCDAGGYSPIRNSAKLTKLSLHETRVTRICRDWRQNMTLLETLELTGTKISSLSFEDLQFTRVVKGQVLLADTPVVVVEMTREDFNKASSTPPSGARVYLSGRYRTNELACDCRMYWTRQALERYPHALEGVDEMHCAGGRLLRELQPEDTECARPEECAAAALPAACACTVRPDNDPDHDRQLVRVRCERAALVRMPRPHPHDNTTERLYELLLAQNNISDLHVDDLHHIKGLDLRNNSLRIVDKETATRLGRIDGLLRLTGNPLECNCSAAPLLRALHGRAPLDTDIGEAKCHDGSALYAASTADCPQRTLSAMPLFAGLAAALVALVTLALFAVVCLASREHRFFLKAVLHRWGCVWRAADPEEDSDRRFDAFVTFSHEDEAVVLEIMARLEPPYRLCVHYRDWIPGRMIPEQIVESVRESRRTVALVSRHFLGSTWARAEFREAHTAAMTDARPRLIVVLLEEPAALEMDDLLQRYLKTNTYVRWGDPWFWDKLLLALPAPHLPDPSNLQSTSTDRPKWPALTDTTVPVIVPTSLHPNESTV